MTELIAPLPHISLEGAPLDWKVPSKKIHNSKDLGSFHTSSTLSRIKSFLFEICEKVSLKNVPDGALRDEYVNFEKSTSQVESSRETKSLKETLPPPAESSSEDLLNPSVKAVLDVLEFIDKLLDETPALVGPRRYGNMACREWHDKIDDQVPEYLGYAIRPFVRANEAQFEGFLKEEAYYLLNAFGSKQRLDYGTGHELSFLAFLLGLVMTGVLKADEIKGTDYLIMFSAYYDLVKKLILTYTLEPAGSHGVWGLDDHFHLIYIIGAAQLVDFEKVESGEPATNAVMSFRMGLNPSSVLNASSLKSMRLKNLYYNAISFIRKVKTGPFTEHSPVLADVAINKSWEKISKGMIKMYYGEVLSKFPVVQHFYFGNILFPWTYEGTNTLLPESAPEGNDQSAEELETAMKVQTRQKLSNIRQDKERFSSPSEQSRGNMFTNRGSPVSRIQMQRQTKSPSPTVVTKAPWAK